MAPVAGTTRDVIEAPAAWKDRPFTLVDTGGLFGATTDPLHPLVVEHGLKALAQADVFVFVLDAREGLAPGDEEIARRLRPTGKPVILAMNKTDEGPVEWRVGKCMGCRYCMLSCPFEMPKYEYTSAAPAVRKCTFCASGRAR